MPDRDIPLSNINIANAVARQPAPFIYQPIKPPLGPITNEAASLIQIASQLQREANVREGLNNPHGDAQTLLNTIVNAARRAQESTPR